MTSVTLERDGAVASVVLPGPALSLAVKEGLLSSLREAAADDRVRAVVLTAEARLRSRFGRTGLYDIAVEAGGRLIAEFRGRSSELRQP